jgi:replicative superfamily II helicase
MQESAASVPAEDPKRRVLKDVFGFDDFRPGQDAVTEALLAGRHVLAVMPTGAGKSLCYQVPALVLGGLTIVVSPLVALMQDQVAALRLAGVTADTINSSLDCDANVAAWRRVAAGQTRLLYLAPERLMTTRMLEALARLDIRLIAVDEAHCISQWGPAFRREYEELSRLRDIFPEVPIIALTATADEATRPANSCAAISVRVTAVRRARRNPGAGFRPAQHQAWHRAQARQQAPIAELRAASCRPQRHCLLPVAQEDRGYGGVPREERRARPRLSCRHEQGRA